ncbi:MAG: UDP-N-acetylmuramoyl-L-alanine--D-glutamate ligase [Alphaproteobacteria bacterium]|nr:UDP-N-acetylmuramoyl-L-alanine--D-glutamate ligase [Alphaproteobacteria bacterium]
MIDLSLFAGKPVAVMGLARSGLAAARALAAGGAEVRAWDDGEPGRAAAAEAGIPLADLAQPESWTGVETLVLSPGIPHTHPAPHISATRARNVGAEIIGDIELLVRSNSAATFVGITGTNGKSTTTALIGHILKQAGERVEIGGNIGRPVCDFEMLETDGFYVLEMSSYQIELTPSRAFNVAVLVNISPDHLDRHGGMQGYVAAKREIMTGSPRGATIVVGVDDTESRRIYEELQSMEAARAGDIEVCGISSRRHVPGGVYVLDGVLHDDRTGENTEIASLTGVETLPGIHNHQNVAAAYAAVSAPHGRINLKSDTIISGIRSFPGLPHRQQRIDKIDGISYINDSKATNAEAAARALACYEDIYWIAGGRAKESDLSALDPYLSRVRHAFLIGEAAGRIAGELRGRVETTTSGDLGTALRNARDAALREGIAGAVVLLSPACASFDQFKDFEQRGIEFQRLVAELPGGSLRVTKRGETA